MSGDHQQTLLLLLVLGGLLPLIVWALWRNYQRLEALVAPVLELADALGAVAANPEEQMRG